MVHEMKLEVPQDETDKVDLLMMLVKYDTDRMMSVRTTEDTYIYNGEGRANKCSNCGECEGI